MRRRSFLAGSAGLPAAAMMQSSSQNTSPAIVELRYFRLRNTLDNQRGRLSEHLGKSVIPALQRSGAGPVGLFSSAIAPDSPFLLLVVQHASLAAFEQCWQKLAADAVLRQATEALYKQVALPYQRMDVHLLRGFRKFPAIETPPSEAGRAPRIFELRTYESNTPESLAKKIVMFEDGEIDLFRRFGLLPVFFGEMIAGAKMPNLTYLVAFDNLAAREANWRAFATSPEWKKMAATPGLSDGEVVSNITSMILSPAAGSMIR
ncbi:MAG: NIPSNAP family protein [Bryobacteraceae bacterium]|nr:NIPSNAP family protein [Bryobacteraceae bacterium]